MSRCGTRTFISSRTRSSRRWPRRAASRWILWASCSVGTFRPPIPPRWPSAGCGSSTAAAWSALPSSPACMATRIPWRPPLARFPKRFHGYFMLNPLAPDAAERVAHALAGGLRGICLFPSMHRYAVEDERVRPVFEAAAATPGVHRVRPLRRADGGGAEEAGHPVAFRHAPCQPHRAASGGLAVPHA